MRRPGFFRTWLARWFGWDAPSVPLAPAQTPSAHTISSQGEAQPAPLRRVAAGSPNKSNARLPTLTDRQIEFLWGIVHPPPPAQMYNLSRDDRVFLAGVSRRLRRRTLDLPALPRVVIRLAETERRGDRPVAEYAAILSEDASLSLEVLRAVNADLFSGQLQVVNLGDAIIRLGLSRLHAMIMATHLRTKVLIGASVRREGELLMDLAAPLATLASKTVPESVAAPDVSFMRGMLMHVEHIIVLGTVADISREHQRAITPSLAAIHEAFVRFGPDIRNAVAAAWEVDSLLLSRENEPELAELLDNLRRAIVHRWARQPLPDVPGLAPARLHALLADVEARVPAEATQRAG